MTILTLLATAGTAESESSPVVNVDDLLNYFWTNITDLNWLFALLLLSVGVVYMLYGWRIFRVLVVISFGFMGMFLGIFIGRTSGSSNAVIWGGIVGMILFACLAVPLMKWCVSVLGAIAGGVITSGIWIACDLSQTYLPAGFIVGFVAGGLISFILLKASVMLFTSLGGSIVMMSGVISLMHQYETRIQEPPTTHMYDLVYLHSWFLPAALILPTVIGMIFQNKFIKQSPKFEVKE